MHGDHVRDHAGVLGDDAHQHPLRQPDVPRRARRVRSGAVEANLDLFVIAWILLLVLLVVLKHGDALFA